MNSEKHPQMFRQNGGVAALNLRHEGYVIFLLVSL